jgi:hypothetical protein
MEGVALSEDKKLFGGTDVNFSDLRAAYSVPAPGANKFIINIGQPGVRIAFGETFAGSDSPVFHAAVTLHPLDAISLYRILQHLLSDLEKHFVESGMVSAEGGDSER